MGEGFVVQPRSSGNVAYASWCDASVYFAGLAGSGRAPARSNERMICTKVPSVPDSLDVDGRPVTSGRPAVSPPLNALVMRCLEKRPADRFQTAATP